MRPVSVPLGCHADWLRNHYGDRPIIGVSGSRDLDDDQYGIVDAAIERLHPRCLLVHGACRGVDIAAAWIANGSLGGLVHAVLPPNRSQIAPAWVEYSTSYEETPFISYADKTGYKRRNQRIVDLSDRLIAFPLYPEDHPQSQRSGTWQTIRMARRKGIMADTDIHVLSQIARR